MVEDDNYFNTEIILKIRNSVSLLDKNDIIWVGSNQCFYSKEQLEKISKNQDYLLKNIPIAGTFLLFSVRKCTLTFTII